MHVGAKKIAIAGLLVAFSVVMLVLSSVIETSTLFFVAAASFCVGIAIREWGLKIGFGVFVADLLLGLLVAPNKLYCITFAGMGLYVWLSEVLWEKLAQSARVKRRYLMLWLGKYVIFNAMYIPTLFFMPRLLFAGKINGLAAVLLLLVGQVVLFIYDRAYAYFQSYIWGKLRTKFLGREYE